MELDHIPTVDELKDAFRWSKPFLWLYSLLDNMSDKTAYFGAITSELHNALINDPKPYRKEVKDLLSNTLFWIQDLGIDALVIDAPNHSQRVRII